MISACWRAPMSMTAIAYNTGCQKNAQRAIAAAIEAHSPAVAASALAGSSADSCLIVAAGNRSGIDLLVLCGCVTSGFTEMSSTGLSDRRKATTLLTLAKYAISLVTRDYFTKCRSPYLCSFLGIQRELWLLEGSNFSVRRWLASAHGVWMSALGH